MVALLVKQGQVVVLEAAVLLKTVGQVVQERLIKVMQVAQAWAVLLIEVAVEVARVQWEQTHLTAEMAVSV